MLKPYDRPHRKANVEDPLTTANAFMISKRYPKIELYPFTSSLEFLIGLVDNIFWKDGDDHTVLILTYEGVQLTLLRVYDRDVEPWTDADECGYYYGVSIDRAYTFDGRELSGEELESLMEYHDLQSEMLEWYDGLFEENHYPMYRYPL